VPPVPANGWLGGLWLRYRPVCEVRYHVQRGFASAKRAQCRIAPKIRMNAVNRCMTSRVSTWHAQASLVDKESWGDAVSTAAIERDELRYELALQAIVRPEHRLSLAKQVAEGLSAIENDQADMLVLAARRMTCIYALLQADKQPFPLQGKVLSDRFTQLADPAEWAGRHVILLDDTRVSGGTLQARAENLRRLVGKTGNVDARAAICIDPDAVDEHYALHNQFARAFADGLLPFFTDFPVTETLELSGLEFEKILAHDAWRTVNVTNAVVSGSRARAYSLFPRDGLVRELLNELGDSASAVEIAKIRVFAYDDGDAVRVRFVPLVLTCPMAEPSVQRWVEEIGLVSNGSTEQSAQALGLVSFMLSRALFRVFQRLSAREFGLELAEDEDITRLMIGDDLNGISMETYLSSLETLKPHRVGNADATAPPVISWPDGHADGGSQYGIIGDDVVVPGFDCLAVTQERIGAHRAKGWEKEATTMERIMEAGKSNILTASLAIDVLNDLGFAVPAPLTHGGYVFRGYRAGEVALRELDRLKLSPHGGRLAAFPASREILDEEYFRAGKPSDASALGCE